MKEGVERTDGVGVGGGGKMNHSEGIPTKEIKVPSALNPTLSKVISLPNSGVTFARTKAHVLRLLPGVPTLHFLPFHFICLLSLTQNVMCSEPPIGLSLVTQCIEV